MFGLSISNPFASLGQKLLSDLGVAGPSAPASGSTPDASGTPTNYALRSPSTGGDTLDDYAQKIGHMESGNRYGIKGPTLRDGDQAYGRYQVLGKNVGPWTQDALGRRLTPEEFLRSPSAQDTVFKHRFGGYLAKYGNPQDAASMWFSGRPYAAGSKLKDQVTNISGKQYVAGTVGTGDASVAEAMGQEAKPGSPLATGGSQPSTGAAGSSQFDYTGSGREGPYSDSEQKKHAVGIPQLPDNRPQPEPQDTDPYQGPSPETLQALHAGDTSVLQHQPPEVAVDAIRAYGAAKRLSVAQQATSPMGGVAQAGPYGMAMTGGIRG